MDRLRAWARRVLAELDALLVATRDPATPWLARIVAILVVAYAFSPLDLIPDVIPVVGLLDDAVLLPLGVLLARRLMPDEVLERCRRVVAARGVEHPRSRLGLALVVFAWLLCVLGAAALVDHLR